MRSSHHRLLIVQPWFTAKGHPAQSLANTACILGENANVSYLVSRQIWGSSFEEFEKKIRRYGKVDIFKTPTAGLHVNTLLSLIYILRRKKVCEHIFFFDAHLVTLAVAWPFLSIFLRVKKVSTIYLKGPEKIYNLWLTRKIVGFFLARKGIQLFLRTEELSNAWSKKFPGEKFGVLPSLELPDVSDTTKPAEVADKLKYAVIGQIRPGKAIEWLVPLFGKFPKIGELTIAGSFCSKRHEQQLGILRDYPNFINRFLPERELLALAAQQHYIVMLYEDWDDRMEAATLFLAARVNRPVIVRDRGWCGRMVREYKCGIACNPGDESPQFFLNLPKPGEVAYEDILTGVSDFRIDHSGNIWLKNFLEKLDVR